MMMTRLLPWLYARLRVGRWLRFPLVERLYLNAFFLYKRYYEDPFAGLAAKRPVLFRPGHILDVGGNVGYTASVFAASVEPGFRVFVFEPEPSNMRRLRHVIEGRGLGDRVVPIQAAVGESAGEAELLICETHPGDHRVAPPGAAGVTIRVPMITLDEFAAEHGLASVAFVKIDVQGLELAVSRGMQRLIDTQPRLAVAFEFDEMRAESYGYGFADLTSFYADRGFRLFLLTRRGDLLDLDHETLRRRTDGRGYVDILAIREAAP